ncbi:hypothetical protein DWUX_2291 [Desulfovibrio diazotrophicus]|nr:hypothetical protein DWUX_2291 [Desulfovibrio diazotrophicus]
MDYTPCGAPPVFLAKPQKSRNFSKGRGENGTGVFLRFGRRQAWRRAF